MCRRRTILVVLLAVIASILPRLVAAAAETTTVIQDTQQGTGTGQVQFSANWSLCTHSCGKAADNSYRWSSTAGSTVTVRFSGNQISLFGVRETWGAIATASIDGATPSDVDFYSNPTTSTVVQVYASPMLTEGTHTLVMTMTTRRNPASTGGPSTTFDRAEVRSGSTTPPPTGCNLASQSKPATASSTEAGNLHVPSRAVDGNSATRWASAARATEWLQVDLGASSTVCRVVLNWETAFASAYKVQTSADGVNWTDIFATTTGAVGVRDQAVTGTGRFVRVLATTPGSQWNYSLWEFGVYTGEGSPPPPPTCPTSVRLMPLGDSITDGFQLPGGYRTTLWDRFTGAGRQLDFVGSQQNGPSSLPDRDHEGHTGWQISQIDAEVTAWLQNSRPDVVLLHIGTNDIGHNVDLPNAPARLGGLIDRMTAVAPQTTIYVSNIIPANHTSDFESIAAPYNAAVPQLVSARQAQGKRVVFVDQHAALTFADLADGLHPNASGYAKMADRWWSALSAGCPPPPTGNTAAARYGWGTPLNGAEFTSGVDGGWTANGPWPGHREQGRRIPEQVSVSNGVMTMTGLPNADTGHMSRLPGSFRGRWEARVRLPPGCACYHPVLILWPDAEDFPVGGEIDYMEVFDAGRQTLKFFLHYGASNSQIGDQRQVNMNDWNHVAVEWTADHMTGFVNGEPFFHTTRSELFPPRPMHPTIQLDWFPEDGPAGTATMEVDWIRQYPL